MDKLQHDKYIENLIKPITTAGYLKCREGTTIEFKETFNKANFAKYAKTMASFSNNKGGYIIFGISDKPRLIKGLQSDSFDNFEQEKFTEYLNSYFVPAIDWDCGSFELNTEDKKLKKIGWIYTNEAENKPIIAQKNIDSEKVSNGDVLYRYRARSQKIKAAEMHFIISETVKIERERLYKIIETIKKSNTTNLGIVIIRMENFQLHMGLTLNLIRN